MILQGKVWTPVLLWVRAYHRINIFFSDYKTYHESVPYIFVSDLKWSFLSNGAVNCASDVYINPPSDGLLIRCSNTPTGRYVSFVLPQDPKDKTYSSLLFTKQIQFYTEKGNNVGKMFQLFENCVYSIFSLL